MSGLQQKSITQYLRPIAYTSNLHKINCAKWLTMSKHMPTMKHALQYLNHLETYKPQDFRNIMSGYYSAVEYKPPIINYDINRYHTGNNDELYGYEQHMYV